jgi:hypothetical protein
MYSNGALSCCVVLLGGGRGTTVGVAGTVVGGGMSSGVGRVSATSSSRCDDAREACGRLALARSATVSVAAQKRGGELTQPMGRANGNATRSGTPSSFGNKTPSFRVSLASNQIR